MLGSKPTVQYAYVVLSVACGYSADKLLRPTMDRVLSKQFVTDEKDKETPQPVEAKPTPEEPCAAA